MLAAVAAVMLVAPVAEIRAQDLGGFDTPAGPVNHADAKLYTRAADGKVRAVIEVTIEKGWHLYHDELGNPKALGKPAVVTMGGKGVTWTKVRFPKPHKLDQSDVRAGAWIYSHEGTIRLYVEGTLAEGAVGDDVTAKLDGQTCSDMSCVDYAQSITSAGAGDDTLFAAFPDDLEEAGKADSGSSADQAGQPVSQSLWYWLPLAFLAGILLNITPCVLPLISIKVLSFVQQAGESHKRMFALGTAFTVGMMAVFWALATAAIVLKLGWGEQFQSATFTVVMIALVFAFALSLMGVFTLGVPKQITQLDAGISREGVGDALFKGMLATLLATPCAGPFMGGTLAWVLGQSNLSIFLVFTALGLGMSLPYMILTTFPKLLSFLPKPGPWMETFKKAMGFVLMAMVIFLMVPLRSDTLLLTNAFLIFVAVGCWSWGHFVRFDQSASKRLGILAASLAVAGLGAWFSFGPLGGLIGVQEITADQIDPTVRGRVTKDRIVWEAYTPDRYEEYRKAGRTVFLDFTANWCKNCLKNKAMFNTNDVRSLLAAKNVVPMKADMSYAGPRSDMLKHLRSTHGGAALPYLVIFPGDRHDSPIRLPDTLSAGTVIDALKTCPDPPSPTTKPDGATSKPKGTTP